MNGVHPDHQQLTGYLLGKLSWAEVEQVESHLGSCAACRAQAASLEGTNDSFVSSLRSARVEPVREAELDTLLAATRALTQQTIDEVRVIPKMMAGHEVLHELAEGGLGVIYLGRHPVLNDLRAIKRPQVRDGLEREMLRARFQREVEAVGGLRHDHIVRSHDAGVDEEGPYLVMEYLDGVPLSGLRTRRRLQPDKACELIRQAALGLQAAHERGLVHRDVKPSNLMLARANSGARVVIIDWGLVKRAEDPASTKPPSGQTDLGAALGTADYVAPEQIGDARSVDIRADIYSLGVTLYCLLAGKPPFHGRSVPEKLLAHQRETFPALTRVRTDIPQPLLAVLQKMVTKNAADRYASPAEVVNALQPFCCAESGLLDLLEGRETIPRSVKTRRIGWLLAAAAVILVASVSVGVMLSRKPVQDQNQPGPKPLKEEGPIVLDEPPPKPVCMTGQPVGPCSSLAFSPDGLYAFSESGGGLVHIWDLQKQRMKESWPPGLGKPLEDLSGAIAVSPDSKLIVGAGINPSSRQLEILNLYDQKTFKRHDQNITFPRLSAVLAFSPDGSRLAVVELPGVMNQSLPFLVGKGKIHVWIIEMHKIQLNNVLFGTPVQLLEMGTTKKFLATTSPTSLAFSPDSKFLATCSDQPSLRVWNIDQHRQEWEFDGHPGGADQVAFSADGKHLFSASSADDTLRVWSCDTNDKKPTQEIQQVPLGKAAAKMVCCTFWKGGRALTGHSDGNLIIWDLHKGKEVWRFTHTGAKGTKVTAVAISPDGHRAVAALSDRLVYLYRLPPPLKQ